MSFPCSPSIVQPIHLLSSNKHVLGPGYYMGTIPVVMTSKRYGLCQHGAFRLVTISHKYAISNVSAYEGKPWVPWRELHKRLEGQKMKAGEHILNNNSKDPEVYVRSGSQSLRTKIPLRLNYVDFMQGSYICQRKKSILLCFRVYIFIFFLWCLQTISKYCSQISVENG